MAEDWVRSATNSFNAAIQNLHDVKKALGTANHKKTQLAEKLKVAKNEWKSAKAGLKSAEAQAEDQCKEFYTTQLNLATKKAAILDLQSKLQRAEKALKVAQEAFIAAETSAYERGALETKTRLTAEVTAICREYCAETYNQALDWAGIPADSDLRRTDQVYYPEDGPSVLSRGRQRKHNSSEGLKTFSGYWSTSRGWKREEWGSGGVSDKGESKGEWEEEGEGAE